MGMPVTRDENSAVADACAHVERLARQLVAALGWPVDPGRRPTPHAPSAATAAAPAHDADAAERTPPRAAGFGRGVEGGVLLAMPVDLLLMHVLPKLGVAGVLAAAATCRQLRDEIESCAGLWAKLHPGCFSRLQYREVHLSTCARCHVSEATEMTYFEHSPGLCASCATRMPAAALRELATRRRAHEWHVDALRRRAVRAELRELLRMAVEGAGRAQLAPLLARPLRLAFSSKRDGHSLTLLMQCLRAHTPAFLLVRQLPARGTGEQTRFGVFVPVPLRRRTEPQYRSDEGRGAFLFSLPSRQVRAAGALAAAAERAAAAAAAPAEAPAAAAAAAPSSASEGARVFCRRELGSLPLDNFYCTGAEYIAFGGTLDSFGLRLSADLQTGSALPCPGFRAPLLSTEPSFRIATLEVWRLVSEEEEELEWMAAQCGQGAAMPGEDGEVDESGEQPPSVLEPGSNRFMLEFVNMKEDLLLERAGR